MLSQHPCSPRATFRGRRLGFTRLDSCKRMGTFLLHRPLGHLQSKLKAAPRRLFSGDDVQIATGIDGPAATVRTG
jgi:hypothetical protein